MRSKARRSPASRYFPELAKLSPPRLAEVYQRRRLFKELDRLRRRPVVWISAPAGAGKTTLAASYLRARKSPCLWYQIDEGDADAASFFYHLGLASRRIAPRRKPLPLLGPEYLHGLATFTRNYFRALFARMPARGVLLLDNYQDAADDAQLHELLAIGLSEIPQGVNAVVLSRSAPPPSLARLSANGSMSLLDWDQLRLTPEEGVGIAKLRHNRRKAQPAAVQAFLEQTQGWVAGLVLLLERVPSTQELAAPGARSDLRAVFDLFANQIFDQSDRELRHFLLATTFLPKVTASSAEQLTGNSAAGRILQDLTRRNYFTLRHSSGSYEYHPLFRAFLINRVAEEYRPDEIRRLQIRSAHLLAAAGDLETAFALFSSANDWPAATALITEHASLLTAQGRHRTLALWLESVPASVRNEDGWLMYWLGVCTTATSIEKARGTLEAAFAAFQRTRERHGKLLACAAILDTYLYEWADFRPLDRWIDELDTALGKDARALPPQLEAQVAPSLFVALIHRQPRHPRLRHWLEHVEHLVEHGPDMSLRFTAGVNLLLYYSWWSGEHAKGQHVIDALGPLTRSPVLPPLARIAWCVVQAIHYLMTADHAGSRRVAEHGLEIANASGVHMFDFMLQAFCIWALIAAGEFKRARAERPKLLALLDQRRYADVAHYHFQGFCAALFGGETSDMLASAQLTLQAGRNTGWPWVDAFAWANVVMAHCRRGDILPAQEAYTHARESAVHAAAVIPDHWVLAARLELAYAVRDEREIDHALSDLFAHARRAGFIGGGSWIHHSLLTAEAVDALARNIEVEYVRTLIRKRRLMPAEPPLHVQNWPWPVKIYTLGRFSLLLDERSLKLPLKSHKKPIELLKAIVALGGRDVREDRLVEALWPDAEADAGRFALTTNLHRLRQLIGDAVIERQQGCLTLSPRHCWVDLWVLEQLLTRLDRSRRDGMVDQIIEAMEHLHALYRGAFLTGDPDEPWLLPVRERLRSRVLRALEGAASTFAEYGRQADAVRCLQQGVEIDPLAESFYRRLMQAQIAMGDRAEALGTYRRCHEMLAAHLRLAPSPETQRLANEIS